MENQEVKPTTNDLLAAWDAGVERALEDAEPADELVEQQVNKVAGMHIESGLRGGWAATAAEMR